MGRLEGRAGQSLQGGGQLGARGRRKPTSAHTPAHVQPARAYLGGAQQPLAVGRGGGGGLRALAGQPWPLGLPSRPDTPEERELQPEGHGSGGPNPAHGALRLQTVVVAQRGERGHPGALMGAAVQQALRAPVRRHSPRGRLASAHACAGRASLEQQHDRHHGAQTTQDTGQMQTRSGSRGLGRRRPPLTGSALAAPARRQINPPLLPQAPRGRAHALPLCQPGGVDGGVRLLHGAALPQALPAFGNSPHPSPGGPNHPGNCKHEFTPATSQGRCLHLTSSPFREVAQEVPGWGQTPSGRTAPSALPTYDPPPSGPPDPSSPATGPLQAL